MDLKIFLVFLFALNLSFFLQLPNLADCLSLPNITIHPHTVLTSLDQLNLPAAENKKIRLDCLPQFTDAENGFVDYTCTDGNWVESGTINCNYCVPLNEPSNGVIVTNPLIGETTKIECNEGYKTPQLNKFVCQANGSYSPDDYDPITICKKVTCEVPEDVAHSSMVSKKRGSDYHYNDTAQFTCDEDYELKGEGTVKCLATGNWSKFPLCELVSSCTSAQAKTRSPCEQAKVLKNHVTFKCDASYYCKKTIKKSKTMVTESGFVHNPVDESYNFVCDQVCQPEPEYGCFCDCLIDATIGENVQTTGVNIKTYDGKKWLAHKTTLDWGCKKGYVKKDARDIICNDGAISSIPECIIQIKVGKDKSNDKTVKDIKYYVIVATIITYCL